MRLIFDANGRAIADQMRLLGAQGPFAAARALTLTAKDAQEAVKAEMVSSFDRPTTWTLRSVQVRPATKASLMAEVLISNSQYSKSKTPAEVLRQQFVGGERNHKALERAARAAGLISGSEILVPGDGAKLDQYGNMSRGQIAQIMSQIRIGIDPYQYATKSKRSRRNQKKAGIMFWSHGGEGKRRGVWMRSWPSVEPIMIVVSGAQYKRRVAFEEVATQVAGHRFWGRFEESWKLALSTS